MAQSERYLLSPVSLAVARVPEGELSEDMQLWAAKFKAFLVAPVEDVLTETDRKAAKAMASTAAQNDWVREQIEQARLKGIEQGKKRARESYKPAAAPKRAASDGKDKAKIDELKAEIRQLKNDQSASDLPVITAERDNLLLKLQVLQDVVSQCGGEDGEKWNTAKLKELAEIVREIL